MRWKDLGDWYLPKLPLHWRIVSAVGIVLAIVLTLGCLMAGFVRYYRRRREHWIRQKHQEIRITGAFQTLFRPDPPTPQATVTNFPDFLLDIGPVGSRGSRSAMELDIEGRRHSRLRGSNMSDPRLKQTELDPGRAGMSSHIHRHTMLPRTLSSKSLMSLAGGQFVARSAHSTPASSVKGYNDRLIVLNSDRMVLDVLPSDLSMQSSLHNASVTSGQRMPPSRSRQAEQVPGAEGSLVFQESAGWGFPTNDSSSHHGSFINTSGSKAPGYSPASSTTLSKALPPPAPESRRLRGHAGLTIRDLLNGEGWIDSYHNTPANSAPPTPRGPPLTRWDTPNPTGSAQRTKLLEGIAPRSLSFDSNTDSKCSLATGTGTEAMESGDTPVRAVALSSAASTPMPAGETSERLAAMRHSTESPPPDLYERHRAANSLSNESGSPSAHSNTRSIHSVHSTGMAPPSAATPSSSAGVPARYLLRPLPLKVPQWTEDSGTTSTGGSPPIGLLRTPSPAPLTAQASPVPSSPGQQTPSPGPGQRSASPALGELPPSPGPGQRSASPGPGELPPSPGPGQQPPSPGPQASTPRLSQAAPAALDRLLASEGLRRPPPAMQTAYIPAHYPTGAHTFPTGVTRSNHRAQAAAAAAMVAAMPLPRLSQSPRPQQAKAPPPDFDMQTLHNNELFTITP